jgi:ribosomal-protein-alanine N-acetyltransferase
MRYSELPYIIEPMQISDIQEVMEIERASFPSPWPANAFKYEIESNSFSHFIVTRAKAIPPSPPTEGRGFLLRMRHRRGEAPKPPILGYGGFWLMAGEAHISTIAVRPGWRRRGIGELLLVAMIDKAVELGAEVMTLEVRVSNIAAQNLYRKYGFEEVRIKRRYYMDSGEDAIFMKTEPLTSINFQARFRMLKGKLEEKLISGAD